MIAEPACVLPVEEVELDFGAAEADLGGRDVRLKAVVNLVHLCPVQDRANVNDLVLRQLHRR